MTPYNKIFQLHNAGKNNTEIVRLVDNVSRKTVITALQLAAEFNLTYPPDTPMTDEEIHRYLHPKKKNANRVPNLEESLFVLTIPGMTVLNAWKKYCDDCEQNNIKPYSRAQYQNIINDAKAKYSLPAYDQRLAFRFINNAISYNGQQYGLLAAELLGSHYIVATLIGDKKPRTWIHGIIQIMHKLQYVPKAAFFTNHLPSSVSAQTKDCLQYYGMTVTHSDKTSKTHLPEFMEEVMKTFIDEQPETAPAFILSMMCNKYNEQPFMSSDDFSIEAAHAAETIILQKVRTSDYDLVEFTEVSPQYNHVQIEGMYYSIPYEYRHEKLTAYIYDHYIEIHGDGAIICVHDRLTGRSGQYKTEPTHLSNRNNIQWNETSSSTLRLWAERIGPATLKTIEYWLRRVPYEEQAYKVCNTVLHFATEYSDEKLETACERAWKQKDVSYRYIKEQLKQNRV